MGPPGIPGDACNKTYHANLLIRRESQIRKLRDHNGRLIALLVFLWIEYRKRINVENNIL